MSSGAPASVTAVIAAAGSGERLGAGGAKAFVPVAGRPMIAWSLAAFAEAGVASIVVACPPGHEAALGEIETDPAVHPIAVRGGATRSESVANAVAVVETDLVAIHDAARPLVTAALIGAVASALQTDSGADAAIAATAVTDTIKRVGGPRGAKGVYLSANAPLDIEATLDRDLLWAAQTPQVFRTEALRAVLEGHRGDLEATDEAMLIEGAGGRVLVVPTTAENLKVTTPLDLRVAESLLAERGSGA